MTPDPEPLSATAARVEAYLDHLLVPLASNLSEFHRAELRRELRAHLWERVDAYRELDHSEENAVTEALKQFGGADDFARQWRSEWITQGRLGAVQEIAAAAWVGLCFCVPLLIATWAVACILGFIVVNLPSGSNLYGLSIIYGDVLALACGVGFFGLSLGIGVLHGRRSSRRSGQGMFAALSVIILGGSALFEVSAVTGLDRTMVGGLFASLPLMAAAWMPTACLAAVLSGWLTGKRRKQVLA